jgi:predicted dehydrogenase
MALSQTLHVVCERGTVTLPAPYAPANGRSATMAWDTSRDHDHPEVAVQVFDEGDQFEHEVTAFSRAVRGHDEDEFGLDDAVANMRVLDAVRASAHSGTWVPL